MDGQHSLSKSLMGMKILWAILLCLLLGVFIWQRATRPSESNLQPLPESALDTELIAKWGKPLVELPRENLIVVTPHTDMIRKKFGRAFIRQYALENGRHVLIWWHHRGGSNTILDFLMAENQKAHPLSLDVAFGGGEYLFQQLADHDMLATLSLDDAVLKQIPSELAGIRLRDDQLRWCGNVLSGFGFLYDRRKVQAAGLDPLQTWQDLTRPELTGQIAIADPQSSGSTVAAFEMIVQSEPDWPAGWRKLLGVLSNAKEFMGGSDDAANAPLFDQATVAICIDFYGVGRKMLEPEKLEYVNPAGETGFTPDPIAVFNNAPNPPVAKAFVDFVLSPQGQDLWGRRCDGQQDMISIEALYRTPIRKDFYAREPERIFEDVKNPYEQGQSAQIDSELRLLRFRVLRQLVHAAAVENFDLMVAARKKLADTTNQAADEKLFFALPDNVDTIEEIRLLSSEMEDSEKSSRIHAQWVEFFKNHYQEIVD